MLQLHWTSDLDQLIRSGQVALARRQLEARLSEPMERELLSVVAALCRRTGLAVRAVKLLAPWVRPPARSVIRTTPDEISEYAAALIQIGADIEGRKLLETLDPARNPRALFFQALSHFSRWDYERALPLLDEYLRSNALTPYERLVGEVNQVAAQVALEREAHRLPELLARTRAQKLTLLHLNLREIQAQDLISQKRPEEALNVLEQASALLREMGNTSALFVRKWKAVLAKDRRALLGVQRDAGTLSHWETIRDCDFHLGTRIDHLYFGTPFEAYRRRIRTQYIYTPPIHYDWKLGAGLRPRFVLDLTGDPFSSTGLKSGQVPHRLLMALAKDFYRPHRLASLHAELFPDRHYNPISSPAVIHQAMKRLRHWAQGRELPLRVIERDGAYRLDGEVALRLRWEDSALSAPGLRLESWLSELRRHAPQRGWEFSHADAMRWGGQSSRTTHRLLSDALQTRKLVRRGAGKATRYHLAK